MASREERPEPAGSLQRTMLGIQLMAGSLQRMMLGIQLMAGSLQSMKALIWLWL